LRGKGVAPSNRGGVGGTSISEAGFSKEEKFETGDARLLGDATLLGRETQKRCHGLRTNQERNGTAVDGD